MIVIRVLFGHKVLLAFVVLTRAAHNHSRRYLEFVSFDI